ncbi:MAG: zinc finger protein [Pyrinomonadaceae bacterium]
MATYEGKWRCIRCSTVNLGRNLNCQSCGVKRSEDIEFFLDDDASAVTDENLLKQSSAGTDWICTYCGGNNRAFDSRCSSCGNTRSSQDKQLNEETRGIRDWSEAAQKAARSAVPQQNFQTAAAKKPFFSSRILKFGLLGLGLLAPVIIALLGILIYISTLTYSVDVEVTGLKWQRSIAIEEYRTVTETAWEGEMPREARVQSQTRALHHTDRVASGARDVTENYTEQVADGTERYVCGRKNKKNGFFEDEYCTRTKYKTVTKTRTKTETVYKDIPVYKTRYTYLIDKWTAAGEKTTSGTDFNPQWAKVEVNNFKTRETGRTESYNLLCKELGGKNKLHEFKLTPENWSKFQNGVHLHGKTNFFGELISVDELAIKDW